MTGSVFFAVIAAVILLVVGILMSPWFIIPAVVVALFALIAGPFVGAMRRTGGNREGSGTPSTGEASYDPAGSGSEQPI